MKDIPIWARWNGQEVVKIEGAETGWYTYHIRKSAEVGGRFALQRVWARARRVGRSALRVVAGLRSGARPPQG